MFFIALGFVILEELHFIRCRRHLCSGKWPYLEGQWAHWNSKWNFWWLLQRGAT